MSKTIQTTCCVIGGGPAGVTASYLLAQRGIDTLLLEAHADFDRDFRGDTLHGGIMELLDQLGLADDLLKLPHAKMKSLGLTMGGVTRPLIDFSQLRTKFPFVTMMPQSQFLEFMVERAKQYSSFSVRMNAMANELIGNGDRYQLQFRQEGDEYHVQADLILACDGRHSKIRRLLDLQPVKTAVPMDVIWFRTTRIANDRISAGANVGAGHLLIVLEREQEWQIGYVFTHGTFGDVKAEGIDWLKSQTTKTLPALENRLDHIQQWNDVAVLNVESSRLRKWYSKNVLLIGDAAHVMSPVGGVGINYAIQDAVVAVGTVAEPLLKGNLTEANLARVQRRRIWPTRLVQAIQARMQNRVVRTALRDTTSIRIPWFLNLSVVRRLAAKFISHGLFKVKIPEANRMIASATNPRHKNLPCKATPTS